MNCRVQYQIVIIDIDISYSQNGKLICFNCDAMLATQLILINILLYADAIVKIQNELLAIITFFLLIIYYSLTEKHKNVCMHVMCTLLKNAIC